jgi:hypothetical protein
MRRPDPEYTFNERGMPTLAKEWDGTIPTMRDFPIHDSGRRARGELEALCDILVKAWMVNPSPNKPERCTAEWLAQQATEYDGRPTTSAATGRVLERWVSVGYAIMERKPIRFVSLTEDGVKLGLDELYRRERMGRKRFQAAVRRGEKPPVD